MPQVVMVVGSGSTGRGGGVALGHFAAARWHRPNDPAGIHEVQISGEGLPLGAEEVLGTLLHEAAHGLAVARGIRDTSRQGRYHNRRFKVLAEELGLQITEDPAIGWSETAVPPATVSAYADTLEELRDAITVYRRKEPSAAVSGTKSRNPVSVVCPCRRRVRVAPSVLALGPITCGVCGGEFGSDVPPARAPEGDSHA